MIVNSSVFREFEGQVWKKKPMKLVYLAKLFIRASLAIKQIIWSTK